MTNATVQVKRPIFTEQNPIVSFKGFDKGYKCRGYTFDTSQLHNKHSIENKKKIQLCKNGFHACPMPNDLVGFYHPSMKQYSFAIVHQWGSFDRDHEKIASKHIKIVKKLTQKQMEKLCILQACLERHIKDINILKDLLLQIAMSYKYANY